MDEKMMIAEQATGIGDVYKEVDETFVGQRRYEVVVKETPYSPKETDLIVHINESEVAKLYGQNLILRLQDGRRLRFIVQDLSGTTEVLNWLDLDGEQR